MIWNLGGSPKMSYLSFLDWMATKPQRARKTWLLVGKGPTFSRRREVKWHEYATLGLNDVCSLQPVTVTHCTDIEAICRLGENLLTGSKYLVMPFFPHLDCQPQRDKSIDFFLNDPATSTVLQSLNAARRLLLYSSSRSSRFMNRLGDWPKVTVRYFSAVAAVNLLALAGVKRIRTLGIDGGDRYADEFSQLKPFRNGQDSFDKQSAEISWTCRRHGINFAPLFRD